MAASPNVNVGAQLRDMLNNLKHYDRTIASAGNQTADLSFMTLLWPLLPLMPPEPPAILTELLREPEECDLCGTSQGTPLKIYTKKLKGSIEPNDTTRSSLRSKLSDWKTPLDRLIMDIEKNMDETLNSIQETTEKSTELSQKANEIEKSKMSDMSDAELLKTLKKLTKAKADQMEKVKVLEVKEQQLKESLRNVIKWARSVEISSTTESEKGPIENIVSENSPPKNDESRSRSIT